MLHVPVCCSLLAGACCVVWPSSWWSMVYGEYYPLLAFDFHMGAWDELLFTFWWMPVLSALIPSMAGRHEGAGATRLDCSIRYCALLYAY